MKTLIYFTTNYYTKATKMSNEFEFLNKILDQQFIATNQNELLEDEGPGEKQKVIISKTNLADSKLYRFDVHKNNFLSFFNKSDNAPSGLNNFCDYILIADINDRCFVILIELKRGMGYVKHAHEQLNASKTFMEYIISTADRITAENHLGFDRDQIYIKCVMIEKCRSNKRVTKFKGVSIHSSYIDLTLQNHDIFYPARCCMKLQ